MDKKAGGLAAVGAVVALWLGIANGMFTLRKNVVGEPGKPAPAPVALQEPVECRHLVLDLGKVGDGDAAVIFLRMERADRKDPAAPGGYVYQAANSRRWETVGLVLKNFDPGSYVLQVLTGGGPSKPQLESYNDRDFTTPLGRLLRLSTPGLPGSSSQALEFQLGSEAYYVVEGEGRTARLKGASANDVLRLAAEEGLFFPPCSGVDPGARWIRRKDPAT